jgi:hypothetical protein
MADCIFCDKKNFRKRSRKAMNGKSTLPEGQREGEPLAESNPGRKIVEVHP